MSLTSFLKNDDVKERFLQEFPSPSFHLKKEIVAPPLTKNYSLVGTAFDYLLRFYIERLNSKAIRGEWVAEWAAKSVPSRKVKKMVSRAKRVHAEYIKSGEMNDELIKSSIVLAQADVIYRAGILVEDFGTVDKGDIADLKNLILNVGPRLFKAKEICVLNPTFGEASVLVGGADGDLLIDNMLIDIKTTKDLGFRRDIFNQLVGYYILSEIGGITDVPVKPKIENLGVYYSRYATLYTVPVENVIDKTNLPSFIKWFKKRAKQEFKVVQLE
jgi:hypothetical protein